MTRSPLRMGATRGGGGIILLLGGRQFFRAFLHDPPDEGIGGFGLGQRGSSTVVMLSSEKTSCRARRNTNQGKVVPFEQGVGSLANNPCGLGRRRGRTEAVAEFGKDRVAISMRRRSVTWPPSRGRRNGCGKQSDPDDLRVNETPSLRRCRRRHCDQQHHATPLGASCFSATRMSATAIARNSSARITVVFGLSFQKRQRFQVKSGWDCLERAGGIVFHCCARPPPRGSGRSRRGN